MKNVLKMAYHLIPCKIYIYQVIKAIAVPPKFIYQHLYFKGLFNVKISKNESFKMNHYGYEIENEIFWNGIMDGWEKKSIPLWVELSKKLQVIMDVGANTGLYALISKTVNPQAIVMAFEPVERVYERLEYNVNVNNYDIICYKKAVSNYTGKGVIYDQPDDEHTYSVTVNQNTLAPGEAYTKVDIDTITMRDVIRTHNLSKIDLLKIDVECHEPAVLEGFAEHIKEFKPNMLIEILTDEVAQKISQIIEGLDYIYINIDESNGYRITDSLNKSDYYNYLLCNKEMYQEINHLIRV